MKAWIVVCVAACASTTREPPPPVRVDVEVIGPPAIEVTGCEHRAQPPEVKRVVGHYASHAHGIGLVIDRTEESAKIRFDDSPRTERLFPRYYWFRTEYHRAKNDKVLEVRNDGVVAVYVGGHEIRVERVCDADPL